MPNGMGDLLGRIGQGLPAALDARAEQERQKAIQAIADRRKKEEQQFKQQLLKQQMAQSMLEKAILSGADPTGAGVAAMGEQAGIAGPYPYIPQPAPRAGGDPLYLREFKAATSGTLMSPRKKGILLQAYRAAETEGLDFEEVTSLQEDMRDVVRLLKKGKTPDGKRVLTDTEKINYFNQLVAASEEMRAKYPGSAPLIDDRLVTWLMEAQRLVPKRAGVQPPQWAITWFNLSKEDQAVRMEMP